ncbi:hypothetical protein PCC9214_04425 [Planktothrix tepida]|uniref:Uncharacterized protein n=1 Tax=Planktothrix tepida PCC 9214 TaxID=671072 RepID=A0A1J1LV64_9CYAN|nr:hypothetical protein [Planktothrix tepida]CAD5978763.1 hypothetical protein PCC9214_04425 [Planktothrix tepida]CUR36126.1 hypothetical protein PL921480236 [Planktothrix tepida PCC 9214]
MLLKAQDHIRTITIQALQQIPLGCHILDEFIEERVIPKGFIENNPNYQLLSHAYFWGASFAIASYIISMRLSIKDYIENCLILPRTTN